jgi:heme/copper-type cytochrome/quinol oxidase subunit 4
MKKKVVGVLVSVFITIFGYFVVTHGKAAKDVLKGTFN